MNRIVSESSVYLNLHTKRNELEKAEAAGNPAASVSFHKMQSESITGELAEGPAGKGTEGTRADHMTAGAPAAESRKEVSDLFRNLLEQIRKDNPRIHIAIETPGTDGERDMLSKVLDEVGDGYALILSDEFMAGLYAGKKSYEKKVSALIECVRRLGKLGAGAGVWLEEDQAVFWQKIPDNKAQDNNYAMFGAGGYASQNTASSYGLPSPAEQALQKFRIGSASPYQTAASYSRMARANSRSMVLNVMQETRRNIATLKLLSVYGDEKDQKKAKAALRSLEKLLLRGNRKLRRFSDESLTETRMKRAKEQEEKERAMQAALELKRRKTSRAIGDGAIRKEGQLEALTIPGYRPARAGRYDPEHRVYVETMPPVGGTGFAGGEMLAGAAGGAACSPVDGYVVSDVMAF